MKYLTKPSMKSFKRASFMCLILILTSPVISAILMIFSPTASEITNPNLGECNVEYKGTYIECQTTIELYSKTLLMIIAVSILASFVLLFIKPEEEKQEVTG